MFWKTTRYLRVPSAPSIGGSSPVSRAPDGGDRSQGRQRSGQVVNAATDGGGQAARVDRVDPVLAVGDGGVGGPQRRRRGDERRQIDAAVVQFESRRVRDVGELQQRREHLLQQPRRRSPRSRRRPRGRPRSRAGRSPPGTAGRSMSPRAAAADCWAWATAADSPSRSRCARSATLTFRPVASADLASVKIVVGVEHAAPKSTLRRRPARAARSRRPTHHHRRRCRDAAVLLESMRWSVGRSGGPRVRGANRGSRSAGRSSVLKNHGPRLSDARPGHATSRFAKNRPVDPGVPFPERRPDQ